MRKKIIGFLIFMLLITTSVSASIISNERLEKAYVEINEIKYDEKNDIEPAGDWDECMTACLAIGGLAGNCLYVIIGCALHPAPYNPCCLAIPILCGIDLGLFFGCLALCNGLQESPSYDEIQNITPFQLKLISFLQKNNPEPLLFLGLLCLWRRWNEIKEWLKDHGFVVPINYDFLDILRYTQDNNKIIPVTIDCGCGK